MTRRFNTTDADLLNDEFDAFIVLLILRDDTPRRGLIFGGIASSEHAHVGFALALRQRPKRYIATTSLIDAARSAFRRALALIGNSLARVVALSLIEPSKNGYFRLVDIVALLRCATFVPCT